jgi:hypothetical protein
MVFIPPLPEGGGGYAVNSELANPELFEIGMNSKQSHPLNFKICQSSLVDLCYQN